MRRQMMYRGWGSFVVLGFVVGAVGAFAAGLVVSCGDDSHEGSDGGTDGPVGWDGAVDAGGSDAEPGPDAELQDGGGPDGSSSPPYRPFPQHVEYAPGCIKPGLPQDQLDEQVEGFYDAWKAAYLRESLHRGYYVQYEEPCRRGVTVSEAHGYGMILMVLMAGYDPEAQVIFDGMMDFYNDHRSSLNDDLMDWQVDCEETLGGDDDCATDGDMDIAYALAMAQVQWGDTGRYDYGAEARRIVVDGIEQSLVGQESHNLLLGDWDQDPWSSRSSDWMADHCRVFGRLSGHEDLWDQVVARIYANISHIQQVYSPDTGLMPDFIEGEEIRPAGPNFLESEHDGDYNYNACRWPWRTALDYAHYGESSALDALRPVVAWIEGASGGTPDGIMAGYHLDGSAYANWTDMAFTAPFAAAAVVAGADHQEFLDALWPAMVATTEGYYQDTVNLLCQIFVSGNWWKP